MNRRHDVTLNRFLILPALALCAASACADGVPVDPATSPTATPSNQAATDDHPPATYSMLLDNGNTVDFYDVAGNALVIETGKADREHDSMLAAAEAQIDGNVADLFRALRPHDEVPAAIAQLAQKVADTKAAAAAIAPAATQTVEIDGQDFGGGPTAQPATQVGDETVQRAAILDGCNNGCCDPDWTKNSLCGSGSGASYSWYLFNYGYSSVALNSKTYFMTGTTCAAVGTSTYRVSMSGGGGGTWSVREGTYNRYHWDGLGFFLASTKSINASVNSAGDQHLHTFCGVKLQ